MPTSSRERGSVRNRRNGIELRAYCGVDPTTGRKQWLEERLPLGTSAKEVGRRRTALVARADEIAATRRPRRRGEAPPGPAPDPGRTVGQALAAYWKTHARHLARSADVRMMIDSYLDPCLGDIALWRLHPGLDAEAASRNPDLVDLTDLFEGLAAMGAVGGGGRPQNAGGPLGAATLHKARAVLSKALAMEVAAGRLAANPCAGVRLPPIPARESTTPEPDELAAFLPVLAGEGRIVGGYEVTRRTRGGGPTVTYTVPGRPAEPNLRDRQLRVYARLVASGPRPQEVSALKRGDYDPQTGRLSLSGEGVVKVKDPGRPERWEVARGETEKRRRRVITLDAVVRAELDALLAEQDEFAKVCGMTLGRRSFLFSVTPDWSAPLSPNTASDEFGDAVARALAAGIDIPPRMRLYDMRHFGITSLLRAGRSPAAVAVRYATSERMIRSRYSHAIPGDDGHLAETLGEVWAPAPRAALRLVSGGGSAG